MLIGMDKWELFATAYAMDKKIKTGEITDFRSVGEFLDLMRTIYSNNLGFEYAAYRIVREENAR